MTKRRVFHYSGDNSIEHGGFYYCLDTFDEGTIDAIRVTPASDAGGPDNVFWIDALQLIVGSKERVEDALDSHGLDKTAFEKLTKAQKRHAIAEALESYGMYDQIESTMIRIGKPDPFHSQSTRPEWDASVQYRDGISLKRLARERCNHYF